MNDPTPVPSLMSASLASRLGPATSSGSAADPSASVFKRLGQDASAADNAPLVCFVVQSYNFV